jgi:hypothetical protein
MAICLLRSHVGRGKSGKSTERPLDSGQAFPRDRCGHRQAAGVSGRSRDRSRDRHRPDASSRRGAISLRRRCALREQIAVPVHQVLDRQRQGTRRLFLVVFMRDISLLSLRVQTERYLLSRVGRLMVLHADAPLPSPVA